MEIILRPLLGGVLIILELYIWVLIVSAVLSWLVAFDVVNRRNRFVHVVQDFCWRLTEPLLRPIRRRVPDINGIDISPILLIVAVWVVQHFIQELIFALR